MKNNHDFSPLYTSSEGMNVINSTRNNFDLSKERVGSRSIEALMAKKSESLVIVWVENLNCLINLFHEKVISGFSPNRKKIYNYSSLSIFIWICNNSWIFACYTPWLLWLCILCILIISTNFNNSLELLQTFEKKEKSCGHCSGKAVSFLMSYFGTQIVCMFQNLKKFILKINSYLYMVRKKKHL